MKRLTYVFLLILLPFYLNAQMSDEYKEKVKQAENYHKNKEYKNAVAAYKSAFASNGNKGLIGDRYNFACSMTQAGMIDSAFSQLEYISTKPGFAEYGRFLAIDADFTPLHNDKRWGELCKKVKENKDKEEANLNKPLVAILDSVFTDDQGGRQQGESMIKKYGKDSKEVKDLWKDINIKDSIDLVKVEKILDQYGWLGPGVVGRQGNSTLFLVIQHADIKTQEKYLPMMREAVKNKKASSSSLALLEDRVALRQGKKQVYGSQIGMTKDGQTYIQPLDDPDNVDKRRAEVGLGPLAEYVQYWNLKWDPVEYKKQLPEIEKMQKETFGK